jgi:hypothetical protein
MSKPEERRIKVMTMDQAPRATGWTIGSPDDAKPIYGLFRQDSWREMEGTRGLEFSHWLVDMLRRHDVTDVYFEDYVSTDRLEKDQDIDAWQKGQAMLICVCARSVTGREPSVIPVSEMRKRFIGTAAAPPNHPGKMSVEWLKNAALRRCAMEGLHDIFDHNVAEAVGHWYFACSALSHRFAAKSDIAMRRIDWQITKDTFQGVFK